MELIGENEYVRTDKGNIGKYKDFLNNYFEVIIKNSPNIIDLVEEGDYIDGVRVDSVEKDENGHVFYAQNYDLPAFDLKDIKSIVTKEQFNQMKYIVGDESNVKD